MGGPYKLIRMKSYSDIPLKEADPWAGPRLQPAFLRDALPGEVGSRVIGNKKLQVSHPDFESKSKSLSRELEKRYPTFTDRQKRFDLLQKEMGYPGKFTLHPLSSFQGKAEAMGAPDRAFTNETGVYMADKFPKEREFGTLAHELRHAIHIGAGNRDAPNPLGDRAATVFDAFGNQFDHHPYDYEDSNMLRSLKDLRLAQETGRAPEWAVRVNPWLRGGSNGILEPRDLMEHIGRISAGKRLP